MKNTLFALIIKFIISFLAAWMALGYVGGNTLGWVLLTAAAVTIINYFITDLIILPSFGNIAASVLDGILAALAAFIISLLAGGMTVNNQIVNVFKTNLLTLAFFGIVIAIMEYFFHAYLLQPKLDKDNKDGFK